jgi:tetratricopeptide (TPR) repeat protein
VSDEEKITKQEIQKAKLDAALALYHEEKYAEAIPQFESILRDNGDDIAANFYAGVSYLAIKNSDAALEKLRKVDKDKDGRYYEAALWYEALAFVQKDKKKEAINTLQKLIKLNGEYKVRAEELLEKLK